MRYRWRLFAHPITTFAQGAAPVRPFLGAHVVVDGEKRPQCGVVGAIEHALADEPSGFLVACARCLAFTESAS